MGGIFHGGIGGGGVLRKYFPRGDGYFPQGDFPGVFSAKGYFPHGRDYFPERRFFPGGCSPQGRGIISRGGGGKSLPPLRKVIE